MERTSGTFADCSHITLDTNTVLQHHQSGINCQSLGQKGECYCYKRCASKVRLALAKNCDARKLPTFVFRLAKTQETKMLHLIQHQKIDSQMESKNIHSNRVKLVKTNKLKTLHFVLI